MSIPSITSPYLNKEKEMEEFCLNAPSYAFPVLFAPNSTAFLFEPFNFASFSVDSLIDFATIGFAPASAMSLATHVCVCIRINTYLYLYT